MKGVTMPNTSSDLQPATGDDFRALVTALKKASRLIFLGLVVLAFAVLAFGLLATDAGDLMADRRLHYGMMIAIVIAYLYVQRS